jgi:sarcosine/dimethylglycine N-methyltransferase
MSAAVEVARSYYNSADADRFYAEVWGGEDIHVGIYETPGEPIAVASRRTVDRMLAALPRRDGDLRVLDLGSGYGGAARHLATELGCRVVGLNLSDVENRRARALNRERRLDKEIEIVDGSFESVPFDDGSFDVVWSQDAILHSGDRPRVFAEVARVLAPEGRFVFTDPMQADDCPDGVLDPILARIHLSSLGSPGRYRRLARAVGLEEVSFDDQTANLTAHYRRVLEETRRRGAELRGAISADYLSNMERGLEHWIAGGERGTLRWGIFHFRRH